MISEYDMRLLPQQGLLKVFTEDLDLKSKKKIRIHCRRSVTIPPGVIIAVAYKREDNIRAQWMIEGVTDNQGFTVLCEVRVGKSA